MTPLGTTAASTPAPASASAERWARVGHAGHTDARTAVAMAYGELDLPDRPELVMMYVSASLDPAAAAAAIADLAPGVSLVGCTSRGELSHTGPAQDSVVLVALGGAGVRCRTAIAPIVDGDARTAAATAARCADELDPLASTVMVVFSDGSDIDQDDVIRGAYDTVGAAIPLVGGGACGAHLQFDPTLFRQDETGIVATSGVIVVAAITSTGPIGIGVGHGFDPDGEPEVVTASGRDVVTTLGERPALDAYLRHHDAPADLFDTPDGFADFARARPLGVARRTRVEPRAVVGADQTARTLTMGATVPPGGLVWLMHGDLESALGAIDVAADDCLDALGGRAPLAVVAFDCAARRTVLGGDGLVAEVDRLAGRAGCPVAGLYTYGEIARTSGSTGFHNLTVVLLAFG